jgi:glycoprotein 6-alpha-L-fucosyltransferase
MIAFLVLWLFAVGYFLSTFMGRSTERESVLKNQLESAKTEVQRLERENDDLRNLLAEVQGKKNGDQLKNNVPRRTPDVEHSSDLSHQTFSRFVNGPTKEYEMCRRTIQRDLNEMWWFVRGHLEAVTKMKGVSGTDVEARLKDTLVETQAHHKSVVAGLARLAENDGHANWRKKEAKDLEDLVQARLHALQNPSGGECDTTRKLVCSLNKGCGFGCQIHHAVYCFITAYGTGRMLVLKSKGWRYDKAGFEDIFLPMSGTCSEPKLSGRQAWPGSDDSLVVEMGIIDSINPRPKFLPPSIPADLSDRMMRLHGDPIVWWVAQFVNFMMRPQAALKTILDSAVEKLEHPVVGIHVRRTDKVGIMKCSVRKLMSLLGSSLCGKQRPKCIFLRRKLIDPSSVGCYHIRKFVFGCGAKVALRGRLHGAFSCPANRLSQRHAHRCGMPLHQTVCRT